MKPTLLNLCIGSIINRYSFFKPADFSNLPTEMITAIFDAKQNQDGGTEAAQITPRMIRINRFVYFNEAPIARTDWACYRL